MICAANEVQLPRRMSIRARVLIGGAHQARAAAGDDVAPHERQRSRQLAHRGVGRVALPDAAEAEDGDAEIALLDGSLGQPVDRPVERDDEMVEPAQHPQPLLPPPPLPLRLPG